MARLVFMGAPDFAVPTLRALKGAGHDVVAVYSQPPRPAGRGKKLSATPVHMAADALQIEVRTPARLRDEDALAALEALRADLGVVVAYGLLLPARALAAPRLGCLNLHASLLPRWRGAAPIQRAIMAGDRETGAGIMRMTEGLDEGPVLAELRTPIRDDDTSGALHARLAEEGAALMVETVAAVLAGRATETPQPTDGATYAKKIDKSEARIDWTRPALEIDRLARGLSPSPGAWFALPPDGAAGGDRVKVLLTAVETRDGEPETAEPGEILDRDGRVACGSGVLRILRARRAGRPETDGADLFRAAELRPGDRLPAAET